MYIKRASEQTALKISKTFPVLLITGPRQVGKSTLLEKIAEPEHKAISLDDFDARLLAKTDPVLFLQRYQPPIIIDEIQYATELLPYIKIAVDKSKRNGDYWLTGSQPFHLMKNISETLAGRVSIISLLGLSSNELYNNESVIFDTNAERLEFVCKIKVAQRGRMA